MMYPASSSIPFCMYPFKLPVLSYARDKMDPHVLGENTYTLTVWFGTMSSDRTCSTTVLAYGPVETVYTSPLSAHLGCVHVLGSMFCTSLTLFRFSVVGRIKYM